MELVLIFFGGGIKNTTVSVAPLIISKEKRKGKAIPLQAWTGPEDSRRLRLPDFKIFGTRRW
jgi:hypothetical protein